MIDAYLKHEKARATKGIPALPLNAEQTADLCELLQNPTQGTEDFLLHLFKERIAPGVDDSTKVKAEFLGKLLKGELSSPIISKSEAIQVLGTMMGGYNVSVLVEALQDKVLAEEAAQALKGIILVYDSFEKIVELAKNNAAAKSVIESWANAEWFTTREELPEEIKLKVYKVEGEINTDDFSPASQAFTRPDIPLHALAMGAGRFEDGIETIAGWRKEGHKVAFVGDVVGTGSSRKSAANSLLWHIGEDIPCVPNKRTAGVVIGGAIAPIFYNTTQDSGGLPIITDVSALNTGDEIIINNVKGEITRNGEVVCTYSLSPDTLTDEYRAGGRIPLIIGKALTEKSRAALGMPAANIFTVANNPQPKANQGYSMAQKLIGKACGVEGVLPGTSCAPKMTTVGSQDTTGPMTRDELKELACLKFEAPMFMQSFCHTAAYPKATDIAMHKSLPKFVSERKGVPLKQGDGVIHSWLNRLLVPDTVGTGGDSHTRFPLGISFPAGSGLVAFAGALGFMPLDMPESVLIKFKGKLNPGITLRDVVNSIPYFAIQNGQLTVPKKNKINIFNGKIIEMEGLDDITVEQAFELTDATAERSAAAGCIKLSEERVVEYVKSNVALMESMIKMGYDDAQTIQNRIDACNEWLANPVLISRDENAEYAATIEIDLSDIHEPILCCPNDPDDVKLLSEVQNTEIQDVFIGSCMTNIGHFRACEKIWSGLTPSNKVRTYIAPPTRMDQSVLKAEATFSTFSQLGVRIETPGCSLCMGNQLRVPDKSNVYSTSTRNFNNRMGTGAQVYLGSAELGALVSVLGKLPTPAEYMEVYNDKIAAHKEEIYKYMQFDKIDLEDSLYQRRDL
ncbi:bifunctional aconitate hydratase 2/2-methylisocitrate dehydratase [Ancylomarina sp. 16SWW S1-10-2]|uniref:bifunctional aconitate hydratase 2/2-methylisocitrate dehydratase n=1 Tax=Ancylomarina sp. 16SWW S1-10-2 TaxID=2499681 RepID=UPI0012AD4AAA|nr:bifunctional aconitate hydratase 2/2-methylisocitrate dehydratase [Ancylomarina sp. 16SWW S1-10-2]MRT93494.1 bifunctional aconitate hydratase 2/2-methylisocitrate dehydratase [Ancylomarina sp. 16SWW S1-10-2]